MLFRPTATSLRALRRTLRRSLLERDVAPFQVRQGRALSGFARKDALRRPKAISPRDSDKKKFKTIYVCEDCGEDFAQWHGKCPSCGSWSTLKQLKVAKESDATLGGGAGMSAVASMGMTSSSTPTVSRSSLDWVVANEGPKLLKDIDLGADNEFRLRFEDEEGSEFGRVLGGGLVPGSMVLVGGDPGVGKSTLLLQISSLLSERNQEHGDGCVLYVSGEESVQQLALRASRLDVDPEHSGLYLLSQTNLEEILAVMSNLRPQAVIIDSIQTVYLSQAKGAAGAQTQIRECATALLQAAKRYNIATFLIGHVTKSRELAGPKMLEHLVDVVLYLEGERLEHHRLLRSVKNRFGSTDEVGVYKMTTGGLKPVLDLTSFFADTHATGKGIYPAVCVTMEGRRPLLIEIQALSSDFQGGEETKVIRSSNGVSMNRLYMLLAVLGKHAGIYVGRSLFVNVTAGIHIREPACDLAIIMAVASSYLDRKIVRGTAFIGEVGLGGELRAVGQLERRVSEAQKVGMTRVIVPLSHMGGPPKIDGIEIIEAETVREAVNKGLERVSLE